jgi:zinc protease
MNDSYKKFTLSNGLLVLLKEIRTAPLISSWIWYRVGSRDEIPGTTGISHWVEHMKFKATPKFPAGVVDKAISRVGGNWNASTALDWTTYYMVLPSDQIDLALSIEADHMVNVVFEPKDVETERTVIISERLGYENEPVFQLGEAIQAMAFRVHSYHHETIGDMIDLENIKRDDLYNHYKRYYMPSNACLAIAGDFECNRVADMIARYFEGIPNGDSLQRKIRPEPAQEGERSVIIEGEGDTTYIQLSYRAPQASNLDFFPFVILGTLLTGPSGLNPFGGGLSNVTSRLYQALVSTGLALGVSGQLGATIDPYLYNILVVPHPKASVSQVREVIDGEINKLQKYRLPRSAIDRALKQARALFAYGSESTTNQAFWLGYSEMFSSYEWFVSYLDRLAEVSADDVKRCAKTYLRSQNCTIGVYKPR